MKTAEGFPEGASLKFILAATAFIGVATAQQSPSRRVGNTAEWRTFTNRAGWSIKYPRSWQTQSYRQCDDPTEPHAYLALLDPSSNEMIMIERLADKPDGKAAEAWLQEVAKDTILTPILGEQWTTLGGSKALKVANERGENIYAVDGSLTIAIRYARPAQAMTLIISTFRFKHRK